MGVGFNLRCSHKKYPSPLSLREQLVGDLHSLPQTGIHVPTELVHAALTALIKKETADHLARWAAKSLSIESILGDRMTSEPIDVAQALKAAYEAAIEADKTRGGGIEELRQFDAGTHPAQHSEAAYDVWVRTKVQAALNDPRPPIDGEVVMKRIRARMKSRFSSSGDVDPSEEVDDFSSTTIEAFLLTS